jgi:hypothetical protein
VCVCVRRRRYYWPGNFNFLFFLCFFLGYAITFALTQLFFFCTLDSLNNFSSDLYLSFFLYYYNIEHTIFPSDTVSKIEIFKLLHNSREKNTRFKLSSFIDHFYQSKVSIFIRRLWLGSRRMEKKVDRV